MAEEAPSQMPADGAASPVQHSESPAPDHLDEMLAQSASFTDAGRAAVASAPAAAISDGPEGLPDQASIEEMLRQATFEEPGGFGAENAASFGSVEADPFQLPNFSQVIQDAQVSSIDLLRDVELNVKIELGRSRMLVEDVLRLAEGSVVELDKLAGDPVDVFVNERLVARGEVLVLNDNFCVRVNEIVAAAKDEGL